MRTQSIWKSLVSLAFLATVVSASRSLSLAVTGPATVNSLDDLKFATIITNTGTEALQVLNDPNGPLNTLSTDTFSIADETGAQPSFTGIRAKYVPEVAAGLLAFTTLAPGQSVTVQHDVASTYSFSGNAATYTISARHSFMVVNGDGTIDTLNANSTAHSAYISGKLAKPSTRKVVRRSQYVGCSSDDQTTIVAATNAATTYATSAQQYIVGRPSDSNGQRYSTWFGANSLLRPSAYISLHYSNIKNNDFSTFTFDCQTCTDAGSFAYVYPDQFGKIFLCPQFWNAPLTGTDSQGGTIVHEASHFIANGGTQDYAYGHEDCQQLAKDNSDEAGNNADSYEYFAENDPALD